MSGQSTQRRSRARRPPPEPRWATMNEAVEYSRDKRTHPDYRPWQIQRSSVTPRRIQSFHIITCRIEPGATQGPLPPARSNFS